MSFEIRWTPEASDQFEQLQQAASAAIRQGRKTKQFGLFQQVEGCIRKLAAHGPRHPGLHSHPFSSLLNPLNPAEKVFESYVQNRTPQRLPGVLVLRPPTGADHHCGDHASPLNSTTP
jgi:hypothetical protein